MCGQRIIALLIPRPFSLLTTLADRSETNFFTGDPLRALSTLSYSPNVDLQRSAALAFAEITEK
jgi:vacuolar protein 8